MADVVIRSATAEDVSDLMARIRPIDMVEVNAMGRGDPVGEVAQAVARAIWARSARMDGKILAIWGISAPSIMSGSAHPWMLSTVDIDTPAARRALVLRARIELGDMLRFPARLWNVVHADNRSARRFIRWLGFREDVARSYEIGGHTFYPFSYPRGADAGETSASVKAVSGTKSGG